MEDFRCKQLFGKLDNKYCVKCGALIACDKDRFAFNACYCRKCFKDIRIGYPKPKTQLKLSKVLESQNGLKQIMFDKENYSSDKRKAAYKAYLENRKLIEEIKSSNRYLANCFRYRIIRALKGNEKSDRTKELLGCTIYQARNHLESLFKPGMTWANHGLYGWHIDHIKPCASFDLSDPAQQKECFNYKNLQPMWAKDNLRKGSKLDWVC